MKKISIIAAVVLSLSMIFAQSGFGATVTVLIGSGGLRFNPTNTFVNTGDTVQWQWQTTPHSTTSGTNGVPGEDNGITNGLWDSGVIGATPASYSHIFVTPGVFNYYCTVHFRLGMTGEVVVANASLPPTIAITNLFPGEVFAAPANVAILAVVTNGSGTVTSVQFLEDTTVLATETSAPFAFAADNLPAGSHSITAIATDSNNLSATNIVNISVVTPVTVSLGSPFLLSGANFQFSYPANIGLNYVVQRSPDLIAWTSLDTNMASSNPVVFVDLAASNSPNFYRVGLLPNP